MEKKFENPLGKLKSTSNKEAVGYKLNSTQIQKLPVKASSNFDPLISCYFCGKNEHYKHC